MRKSKPSTTVVLLIYKRLSTVKRIIESLNSVDVDQLFIVADGPKNPSEKQACDKVINYIKTHHRAKNIYFNISDRNLGLRERIITGLNWVFEQEDQAIILEDDCIPDTSFFPYAKELLAKYESDERVLSIAGFTSHPGLSENSYLFSRFIESWGWATWKRAWAKFDPDLRDWQKLRKSNWLEEYLGSTIVAKYWRLIFDDLVRYNTNSWAYRWMYTAFRNKGLTIYPTHNLISNIGFDSTSTHTKRQIKLPPVTPIQFPLIHPAKVAVSEIHDKRYNRKILSSPIGVLGLIKSHVLMRLGLMS